MCKSLSYDSFLCLAIYSYIFKYKSLINLACQNQVEMESDMAKLEESVGSTAGDANLAQDILREMEATELKEEVESAALANENVDMLIRDAYQ